MSLRKQRSQPAEKPRPKIGDFVATDIAGWCISKQTGPGFWDTEFFGSACATKEGAEKLAAMMNAARDLADHSRILRTDTMYRGTDPKLWALHCIVSAVGRAIDGPQPEMFHEFLQRRNHERCVHCNPSPLLPVCEAA